MDSVTLEIEWNLVEHCHVQKIVRMIAAQKHYLNDVSSWQSCIAKITTRQDHQNASNLCIFLYWVSLEFYKDTQ